MRSGSASTRLFAARPFVMKSPHTCGPNMSAVAPTSASVVTVADANTRQRPDAISITGSKTPSCGFSVSSPMRTPARIGRRSSQKKIVTSIAAVINELCPEITQRTAAGETRECDQRTGVIDVRTSDREEERRAEHGPDRERRQIAERAEGRREEENTRRIGPVLSRIVRAEQRIERADDTRRDRRSGSGRARRPSGRTSRHSGSRAR